MKISLIKEEFLTVCILGHQIPGFHDRHSQRKTCPLQNWKKSRFKSARLEVLHCAQHHADSSSFHLFVALFDVHKVMKQRSHFSSEQVWNVSGEHSKLLKWIQDSTRVVNQFQAPAVALQAKRKKKWFINLRWGNKYNKQHLFFAC